MPSAPSRFEVEHLHRLMMQASAEAVQLEGRLGKAQTADGLWPLLRHWHEAAGALDQALARASVPLEQDGTPKDQIDRIRRRLAFLEQKSKQFDLEVDLDECVQSWNGIGLELAQLSGRQRDALVRLLQERKPAIDRATAMLSEALRHEGLLQEDHRKRAELCGERDRARVRYERLREAWLAAQRDWEAAQRQHGSEPGAQQHEVRKSPVPDLRQHATSPVIVRAPLPEMKAPPAHAGPAASKLPLNRLLERGHRRAEAMAARVEKTLSHLTTAEHRTLTDPTAGELRAHLARMDSVLARLSGKRGDELRDGAREVSTLLHRMSAIATRAGASAQVAPFRKLMEERKGQLRRLALDSNGQPRQAALWPPPVRDLGHPLRELRGSNPGLDRLLLQSSQAQLAAELSKQSRAGLHSIPATQAPQAASPAAATLAGFGGAHTTGLGALAGGGGALANALEKEMRQQRRREMPRETSNILARLHPAPEGTALKEVARRAELRDKQLATRSVRKGPPPSAITGAALLDAVREHPKGRAFAAHLAPGGPLRALCETVQRGHGLPIGQAAQHYLASRGSSHLWNAVATFNTLAREGYTPRFSLGSWLRKNVSDPASHALRSLPATVGQGALAAASLATGAREGISSLGQRARGVAVDVARGTGQAVRQTGRALKDSASLGAQSTWGQIKLGSHALARVGMSGLQAGQTGASWLHHKAGAWAKHEVQGPAHWLGERVHSGLEWAQKTGVVGAVGTGLRKGLSFVKGAAGQTPLGSAVRQGLGLVKSGGLARVWNSTGHLAGKAWAGIKAASAATSRFVQSPAGQLLVTGLSLAASFIPGGLVVKAMIGAGIGALQAISDGKDWKAVLASAAGGAITGAIPFLKIGPLAKLGVGALQGGITALASGGSLKDALKGAGGGALDAFDPGAFHALKKLKTFSAAERLLRGRKLPKHAGPLRGLEKALSDPRARRVVGALERAGSKGVKSGIWVSGKAARAQHVLDKAVRAGELAHGALSQAHDLAPGLAEALGDNDAGHFVARAGDWAGSSDDRLQKALGYGHKASGALSRSRGYLDKGLGFAGVKDPAKAYEKMSARADLRAGRKGALEHVAQLKLEDHRRKHPELHLAEANGMRTRRVHGEEQLLARKRLRREAGGLEKAIERGRELMTKGRRVAQGAHDKLGKVHDVVDKGLVGAGGVQSGLEKASALARQGAGVFGQDSDIGQSLIHAADRADQIHDHLAVGIDAARKLNRKVGATHDLLEMIPGIEEKGEQEAPAYLEGGRRKRSPHGHAEPPEAQVAPPQETEEQRAARLRRAWEKIGSVSSQVQRFELESAKAQRRIEELLREGKANEASTELMGLGSRCEQIDRAIREAKVLCRGHEKYEKEVGFYEDWHRQTREKLHARIADTQGLGGQVAISGFGIQESTHPDIFENTRAIYAVRTKVQSFAGALHDPHAIGQVGKVLAEARKAKSDLQALKAKYRKDKAAHEFLTGGGTQDKLIDEALQKLAGAEKAAHRKVAKVAGVAEQVSGMLGEDSALGQLAQQLGDGAGRGQGKLHEVLDLAGKGKKFLHRGQEVFERVLELAEAHHAKEIGKGAVHELQGVPHEGWDLTAENARVAFEPVNGLHGSGAQPPGGDRDAPQRIETDGGLTTPASGDRGRDDPFSDLLDDMFAGEDARIHVDRGGARLDLDELDLQDVDPAAMDTWIGSGEAVKLFSEVFGAFIPAEAAIVVHAGGGHGQGKGSEPGEPSRRRHRRRRKQRGGFFARLFDQLEGFADRIGGWAKKGSRLLGKGMHFAELGMHGLSQIEGAAERVQGFADKSEGFLERMGLHRLAGYAGRIGAGAGWVDEEAKLLHGGLKTADQWMGRGKEVTGGVEQGAHAAAGIFDQAAQGRSGTLVNLFRASRNGDGIDGKLSPDRVPLGSVFDEPRRLDVSTLSRMGSFLGGDFSGVRIHTGPGAAEVTRRFNAEAVTVKDHIFFAPGRFNPTSVEGQKLIAHELTHVLQKGRANLDVRTAEGEALHSEHTYGPSPSMETLNLRRPEPGFRLAADGEGMGASSGIHTAKRTRSRGDETGSKDTLPDGEELLEQVSGRVYELLMEELEQGFQSR